MFVLSRAQKTIPPIVKRIVNASFWMSIGELKAFRAHILGGADWKRRTNKRLNN